MGEGAQIMDGYNHCIVGVVERFGQPIIVCYDKAKIIETMCNEGMTEEESLEFFEFNQIGAWVGETTPCFLVKKPDEVVL